MCSYTQNHQHSYCSISLHNFLASGFTNFHETILAPQALTTFASEKSAIAETAYKLVKQKTQQQLKN